MTKPGSATDPLWYKDAVIYEIHVRAFADSNGDGIGDFPGLMSRLDYLQNLGVTCLWLLPFFPSPLRDDGYDIANYVDVNPAYGTLADFQAFLDAAHARGMQVMIELVINHTSDQHPWFKAAQLSPPGSPERAMYVWSDTDKLYSGVRIIFTDTEKSNWTWDETAKQFYWHRFFSHQPDLNFDNPRVMDEVINAMRFWMDMGVDALRLDAIPYLLERDGTSCENVPETHDKIKAIRAVIDAEYGNRLILAEANMWPADVRPYFGDGDECHMAFHFPLMPRIYMALRQEDRLPITDIMGQTPPIPEACQWGLFLRNHDELTLEMVTDDERDYMNLAYAADARMRINVGIRRRLAPLMDNNRRRIELLNSLLLSFPGTPILYYGDEIGMGDNIYLGDRNGVRTPMQWNSDRNAGFSKSDPARLYFPVVMDPIYGYQVINVEAQESDQSSLLHWTRNMIALRKLFQVFGRGTLEFLNPDNRKILAYLRDLKREDGTHETVLCVANLSRFAQPVQLDLSRYTGCTPVEMLGYVPFPLIDHTPYALSLSPYSFLWFELQPGPIAEVPRATAGAAQAVVVPEGAEAPSSSNPYAEQWEEDTRRAIEASLPAFLKTQRWFGGKTRGITSVAIGTLMPVAPLLALAILRVTYVDGAIDRYLLPLGNVAHAEGSADRTLAEGRDRCIVEASTSETLRQALLALVEQNTKLGGKTRIDTCIEACHSSAFPAARGEGVLPGRTGTSEQSNINFLFGDRLLMKLFRRLQPGVNPDSEIGRFLTETAHFPRIAPFLGEVVAVAPNGEKTAIALLQGLVHNQGDGWQWTLESLAHFFASVASHPAPQPESQPRMHVGPYLDAAALLGKRTAELHGALATPTTDTAFAAETVTAAHLAADAQRIEAQLNKTLHALQQSLHTLSGQLADDAAALLSRRIDFFNRAHALSAGEPGGKRTRIHGDYHLGQILRADEDFVILDFEGEPARTLAERREKQDPLRDVAGMLRSFSYAAATGLAAYTAIHPAEENGARAWARFWETSVCSAFVESYRRTISSAPGMPLHEASFDARLSAYLIEKALYELLYELNNRPTWVGIPLAGLLALTEPHRPEIRAKG